MSGRVGKRSMPSILAAAIMIGAGAAAAFCLMLGTNPQEALSGMKTLMLSGFTTLPGVQKTLLFWPLLMLTGLSVGCAWKAAGAVHLGAPGQFTLGAFAAMSGALLLPLPWWACLLLAALGGAVGGAILGMTGGRSRMQGMLSAVMLNYTAVCLSQWLWEEGLSAAGETASLNRAALPVIMVGQAAVSPGLIIGLLLCLGMWILLRFTVVGYEIRAGGSNREAARRAGMPAERNRKRALLLSGAFSGLAGGVCLLSGMTDTALPVISAQMGFAGIPAAMLCQGHPLGLLLSSLAAAGLYAGGEALPPVYPQETAQALLAFSLLGCAGIFYRNHHQS